MATRKNESIHGEQPLVTCYLCDRPLETDFVRDGFVVLESGVYPSKGHRASATRVWDSWCNDDSRPIDTSPADSKKSHVFARARDADQPGVDILPALLFCLAYCGH